VALAALFGLTTTATTAAAKQVQPLAVSSTVSALEHAYAAGRGLPASAVGGVRAGSLHEARDAATGQRWAVADFVPAAGAPAADAVSFQDGASRALFSSTSAGGDGNWQLQRGSAGLTSAGCTTEATTADAPSAAVLSALSLPAPGSAGCAAASGAARPSAAQRAAAAHPDSVGTSIASIALGQVGVATNPAQTAFGGVDCDPYSTMVGAASPNSDGCGADSTHSVADQNEEWCSDFAKWVYEQAGITGDLNTVNAGADSWYAWAVAQGESPAADSGTPQPGDAVLFYPAGTITSSTYADHVGLITSVNSDGTVDMANGDFLGSNGITVEYNENLDLTSWAGSTWSSGEQWVLITPPSAAQSAAPAASISAPHTAAAGTAAAFTASATESGGSITGYAWTFGDGRNNNATGASASHVFTRAGLYTVTMTATSNLGTVTTKTWNVGVSAPSAGVSSTPDTSVWYTTDPVKQYSFTENSAGALAVDSWDGAAWLQQTEPGTLASGSGLTSLTYTDPAVTDATIPHAFYRTSGGALGETFPGTSGWTSATLAGSPAATSAISGIAADPSSGGTPVLTVTPSVFYFDASGTLDVSTETGSTWSSAAIQGPTTSAPRSLAVADSGSAEYVFYLDSAGDVVAATNSGGSWSSAPIPNSLGVTAGTSLAAAATGSGINVFFHDVAGKLAAATLSSSGSWTTADITGTPTSSSAFAATNTLTSSGAVVDEVYYLASAGTAGVTWWTGSAWQAAALPGAATAIDAVSGNDVPGSSQQVFLANGSALSVDTSSAPGAAWSSSALPSTPTAYPGTVLLYAATSADDSTALSAASYAGLAASQVTTSFAAAWAAVLSGNYLVITVGQAAYNALYENPCGWTNPSQDDPGTTPFDYVVRPLNVTLTNLFLVGAAATASKSAQRTDDLAYYAAHGALPAGATVPTIANPGSSCLGSAG
jgi:PKD repeat protein